MADVAQEERRAWISTLARAAPARLSALMPALPDHSLLRKPETGAIMVRGRIGATGGPFNLGEMTVTRCSVQLGDGVVGHAWVQGRDKGHALRAAVADALLQTSEGRRVRSEVIDILDAEMADARRARAGRAAATKVEFFTLVRGEDA